MTTNTPSSTSTSGSSGAPEKVFVEIPKAKPGQEYHAPKNYQQPLLDSLSRLAVIGLCISLPVAPALIFALVLGVGNNPLSRSEYLWIWIPMILLIETIGIFVAIGVAREALGTAGDNGYGRRTR